MANINENLLVRGARGNVGKQFVYRKQGKNTHIAKMPTINKKTGATTEQIERRELFASAVLYAQGAIASAELKKEYQKKAPIGANAFNMAFKDYLKAPVVKKINTANYNGAPGSTIVIHAKDDFRVAEVKVKIFNAANGNLLEEGNALLNPVKLEQWIYAATVDNNMGPVLIRATAIDLPGNEGMLEVSL